MGVRVGLKVSGEPQELAEQMLSDAHGLIVSGWCQGAGAVDEMGRQIEPSSAFARRWSAPGALERIWRRSGGDQDEVLQAFERANLALAAAVRDVPQRWNDDPGRTRDEVLFALARAHRFLGAHDHPPLELVEDLVDGLDRYETIPGLLFERPA
jgi:hypothetical protein